MMEARQGSRRIHHNTTHSPASRLVTVVPPHSNCNCGENASEPEKYPGKDRAEPRKIPVVWTGTRKARTDLGTCPRVDSEPVLPAEEPPHAASGCAECRECPHTTPFPVHLPACPASGRRRCEGNTTPAAIPGCDSGARTLARAIALRSAPAAAPPSPDDLTLWWPKHKLWRFHSSSGPSRSL
jgi:hypothetical protein